MTKRERRYLKYHKMVKSLAKMGIGFSSFIYKKPKRGFGLEELRGGVLAMPNYAYDKEGKIIPPANGEPPRINFHRFPSIEEPPLCFLCNGTGESSYNPDKSCSRCGGSGVITQKKDDEL